MSSDQIVIGSDDVVETLKKSGVFNLFREKFTDIAGKLKTRREDTLKWIKWHDDGSRNLSEIVYALLENWKASNGCRATLKKLMIVLNETDLVSCSEDLEDKFLSDSSVGSVRKDAPVPATREYTKILTGTVHGNGACQPDMSVPIQFFEVHLRLFGPRKRGSVKSLCRRKSL